MTEYRIYTHVLMKREAAGFQDWQDYEEWSADDPKMAMEQYIDTLAQDADVECSEDVGVECFGERLGYYARITCNGSRMELCALPELPEGMNGIHAFAGKHYAPYARAVPDEQHAGYYVAPAMCMEDDSLDARLYWRVREGWDPVGEDEICDWDNPVFLDRGRKKDAC